MQILKSNADFRNVVTVVSKGEIVSQQEGGNLILLDIVARVEYRQHHGMADNIYKIWGQSLCSKSIQNFDVKYVTIHMNQVSIRSDR